jgi:hypothetical protein
MTLVEDQRCIRDRFRALGAQWNRETGFMSNVTQVNAHPAYREIVSMGHAVVPFLLEAINVEDPEWWFDALKEIYGDGPVIPEEARGRNRAIARLWLDWVKKDPE